jgi:N-acetylneuraminate synthase
MDEKLELAGRLVGSGERPFIIADIGANHNGDMKLCKRLIDAAIESGVDVVKFQSWTYESLFSREAYEQNPGLLREVKQYQFTPDQHLEVQEYCSSKGITYCCTPFSTDEVDMLEDMKVPFYKVASMHLNNLPLLEYIAKKNLPMIVSTGMGTLAEIEQAVNAIRGTGNNRVVLLHCVSLYPPDFDNVNLRNIQMLSNLFGAPVGFSDHTIGVGCSLAAVALGACVVEKHFTLDKSMEGWDHAVSADPLEMSLIVQESENVWRALGDYRRVVSEDEIEKAKTFRQSVVLNRSMEAGEIVTEQDIDFKRPGTGISPDEVTYVLGRKLKTSIEKDTLLSWDDLD